MTKKEQVTVILCGLLSNHNLVKGISDICVNKGEFDGDMFDEIIINDAIALANKINLKLEGEAE